MVWIAQGQRDDHEKKLGPAGAPVRSPACELHQIHPFGAASGFRRRPRHPPNSPTTVTETVTHTAAPSVIQIPTFAMSRIEK